MTQNVTPLHDLLRQLKTIADIAGTDTTVLQAMILIQIGLIPGERLGQVAERIGVVHTTVTRAVDILGDHQGRNRERTPAGLVERRDDPTDRRVRTLWLTQKGRGLMARLLGSRVAA